MFSPEPLTWWRTLTNEWKDPSTTNHGHQMLQGTLNGLIVCSAYLRSGLQRSWEEKHHHNDLSQGICLVCCSSPNLNQILTDASAHLLPVSRKEKGSSDVRKITLEPPVLCMDWNYTHQDQHCPRTKKRTHKIASTQIIGHQIPKSLFWPCRHPATCEVFGTPHHTLMWTQEKPIYIVLLLYIFI